MASDRQVNYIEHLMNEREIGDLADTLEAKTVACGMGDELSSRQASRFIEDLLACPMATQATIPAPANIPAVGSAAHHKSFGEGTVLAISGETVQVKFGRSTKWIHASYLA